MREVRLEDGSEEVIECVTVPRLDLFLGDGDVFFLLLPPLAILSWNFQLPDLRRSGILFDLTLSTFFYFQKK